MEFNCKPNLPQSKVKRVFISEIFPEDMTRELNDMGIVTYRLGHSANMTTELKYHPDILLNNFLRGRWMCEYDAKYLPKELPHSFFEESENELDDIYPYDCIFNNFRIGHVLVCGAQCDYFIRSLAEVREEKIIKLSTSYAKCSCVLVNENAIITCDRNIGIKLRSENFDVLTVEDKSEIGLRGFSSGFIGGCAGKVAPDLLVFTGNLNRYKYGDSIKDFCANHHVNTLSLTNEKMYDYGGILPITEYGNNTNDN